MSAHRLIEETILTLDPVHLPNRNPHRYLGHKERVTLEVFAPEDRKLLRQAYGTLHELFEELKPVHAQAQVCRKIIRDFLQTPGYRELAVCVAHLGHATASAARQVDVDRLVHDLRGGAFQALIFRLQLFEVSRDRAVSLQNIYFLVRDHLKIMRNCVADLDPDGFNADLRPINHDVDLLIEKWAQNDFYGAERPVHVDLHCHFRGTLCGSCMEFSSLDRVIYNLMNNAARFSADGSVLFCIGSIPREKPEAVRFAVANAVTPGQRQALVDRFGDEPGELFRGGFTTGGHGVGARICADFCSHAFGIMDFDEALQAGYFGARWIDDRLAVWFHWPIQAAHR